MSLFGPSNVFLAILFGGCAVFVPRFILPLFYSKSSSTNYHRSDYVQQAQSSMPHNDNNEDFLPDIHNEYSSARISIQDVNSQQHLPIDVHDVKSNVTFALPMYTVGIGIFLLYTCVKYFGKRSTVEKKIRSHYSANNIEWNNDKRQFKYQSNRDHIEDVEENDDSYAGLDPDYVAYLKARRQKELESQKTSAAEQTQMCYALDEMKTSLSFINSKIGTEQARNNLTQHEISQLQDRLASTETQMYKLLNTINTISNRVHELTGIAQQSLEQSTENFDNDEEYNQVTGSNNESEESINDEENSNSEDNSMHQDEQMSSKNREESSSTSASSYEDDDEGVSNEAEDDDGESESSCERYGIMNTNYGSDHSGVDDYEINTIERPLPPVADSRTKVQEWHQRNHSQSLSSSNASLEEDQAKLNDENQSIPNNDE